MSFRHFPCGRELFGQPYVRTETRREVDPDTGRARQVERVVAIEAECSACGDRQRVEIGQGREVRR